MPLFAGPDQSPETSLGQATGPTVLQPKAAFFQGLSGEVSPLARSPGVFAVVHQTLSACSNPWTLAQVADMLRTQSVAEVARDLGIPRRTFRDRHLAQLREAFAANRMDDYLR